MGRWVVAIAIIGGCERQPIELVPPLEIADPSVEVDATPPILDTGPVSDTTTPVDPVCTADTTVGPYGVDSIEIRSDDDFDFDADGFLVSRVQGSLLAFDRQGAHHPLSPSVWVDDVAGVRSLPSGDLLVVRPSYGQVQRLSGPSPWDTELVPVMAGLAYPFGLEVASDGTAFVSEFIANGRVWSFDPDNGSAELVVELAYPNGLALSADESTLYVSISSTGWTSGAIAAIDRDANGAWVGASLRVVYEGQQRLDALAVDVCDNLYASDPNGHVIRIRPDGTVEQLANLAGSPESGGYYGYPFTAMRFGAGLGGFDRTELFVATAVRLYAIDVGIDGRHVLAP
ncbi:MAG: SMP-30/gluconolactonase/LRE family protein [Myxococcota bacterium]